MSTLLVFRSDTGTEIARQVIDDPERATRIMIARNRAELMHRTGWTWGIETEEPFTSPGYAGPAPEGVDYSDWIAINNID